MIRNIVSEILSWLCNLEFGLIGHRFRTFNYVRRLYFKNLSVDYGDPFSVGTNFYLRGKGNFTFGQRCSFGSFTRIWNYATVSVGDDFLSAGGLTINAGSHELDSLKPTAMNIRIGNRVWCGVNVTILAGVTIGDDAVIAAGSLINRDVEPGAVVAGVPAKIIKRVDLGKRNDEFWSPFKR